MYTAIAFLILLTFFSLEEKSILEISNFMTCSLLGEKLHALKGSASRFELRMSTILSTTRYQFGQLNDPHLQGAKRVICSVISVAAASSSYRAVPLPSILPRLPPKSWGIASRHRIYRSRETLLHVLAIGAAFSYRCRSGLPRRCLYDISEDLCHIE